jgi:hypothetical protein
MAAVTVFVDDAVLGRLPPICVKDGVATTDRLTLAQDVGGGAGLGVAWLLMLAGPLGWLGLVVLSFTRRGSDYLTVTLPYSELAYERVRRATAARRRAALILAGASVATVLSLLLRTTDSRLLAVGLAVVAGGALIEVIVGSFHLHRLAVPVVLDASRRWVTLYGVHPRFADAAQDRNDAMDRDYS